MPLPRDAQQLKPFSFRGLCPLTPTRGSAPGPRWGLCPQTLVIVSRSALAMGLSPPKLKILATSLALRRYSPLERKKYLLLPIPLPLNVFGVSMSGPFFKYDHLATVRDRSAKSWSASAPHPRATRLHSNATRNSRSGIPSFGYSVHDVTTDIAQCALQLEAT